MLGPLFNLGRIVATPGALASIREARLRECLYLHQHGDWGSVCEEDARENDLSVAKGFRILSCYAMDPEMPAVDDNRLWILTEADRSVTAVLLPSEY
jgi:hypothetical protein